MNLIEAIRKERGLTFLFISHDLRVVAGLCDEVALMADGVIAGFGVEGYELAVRRVCSVLGPVEPEAAS